MWGSIKEYALLTLRVWWAMIIGGIGALGTIAQLMGYTLPHMPLWAWLVILFLGLSIAQFLAFREVRRQRNKVQRELKDVRTQSLVEREPTLIENFKKAKMAWVLWFTGTKARADKVLETGIPVRILLLVPDVNDDTLLKVLKEAETPLDEAIADIKFLTRRALMMNDKIQIGWYSEDLGYTLSIYETNPQKDKNNEPIPTSDEAWLVFAALDPKAGAGERTIERIFNRGKDAAKFQAYLEKYKEIWKQRVRVKLENDEPAVDNE